MFQFIAANLPMILLFLGGVALLVVEAFIPGFGIAGICGILAGAGSVVLAYTSFGLTAAIGIAFLFLLLLTLAVSMSLKSATRGRLSKSNLVLTAVERSEDGYRSVDDMNVFLGHEGITTTVLRPTGIADFDGVRLNVVSEGDFIQSGTRVRIIKTEASRVIVRPVNA